MQNRTFSEYCPSTHLVSRCAYSLSGAAFNETGKSVQRRKNPVGLSPSSVQPEFRDGQILLIGSEISRGGMLQVSQGGKQESLSMASPVGEAMADLYEAVAEPVHFDALEKPERMSSALRQNVMQLQAAVIHRLIAATEARRRLNLPDLKNRH